MFDIKDVKGGKMYTVERELYTARVYVPDNKIRGDVINLGFDAPYLMVFEEHRLSDDELVDFSMKSGFSEIAAEHDSSVVFVYPANKNGWKEADSELFKDIIAQSKIGQFYENGVMINVDRFHQRPTTYNIRGAIFRTFLYGFGESADYIANNLCCTIDGEYLWGPGEITPTGVCLERLSNPGKIERNDIPVISINNSDSINEKLKETVTTLLVKEEAEYKKDYYSFFKVYKRWCGNLVKEADFNEIGVCEEYGIETVKTSLENEGPYAGTTEHEAGYFAWYNKGLLSDKKVPTVVIFHGGGDSALHISKASGWWEVAHKYNFLLIAVENHLNLTATETVELINKLKEKYPIDENRLYASGFSMGGCKSWDMLQEYPEYFTALAPMDATFEIGLNVYGKPSPRLNREIGRPVFYSGGEITPLPELPFQAQKCFDRIDYLFKLNKVVKKYDLSFEKQADWENPIWGINGDRCEKIYDESRDSFLTIQYFVSEDGVERTALSSVSGQGHECRQHTCEHAWLFMSKFSK